MPVSREDDPFSLPTISLTPYGRTPIPPRDRPLSSPPTQRVVCPRFALCMPSPTPPKRVLPVCFLLYLRWVPPTPLFCFLFHFFCLRHVSSRRKVFFSPMLGGFPVPPLLSQFLWFVRFLGPLCGWQGFSSYRGYLCWTPFFPPTFSAFKMQGLTHRLRPGTYLLYSI